jgi:chromosomal replication initiation ATPase DnaA
LFQLYLPFFEEAKSNFFSEESFLKLKENSISRKLLENFFTKKTDQSLVLIGEAASGKTHLLHIFAQKFGAEFLSKDQILGINLSNFFTPNCFYIFENIDRIHDQNLLLHLINSAAEAQAFLILSTQKLVKFQLKDLESRLKNIFTAQIENPELESVKQLLAHHLAIKQIKLSRHIINFITNQIKHDYQAIFDAAKLIEFYIQESGKNITIPMAQKIFKT